MAQDLIANTVSVGFTELPSVVIASFDSVSSSTKKAKDGAELQFLRVEHDKLYLGDGSLFPFRPMLCARCRGCYLQATLRLK